ncbi:hypothetical protein PENCOP_c005G02634 [Penicillium coprophilum]|uniref:ABC multidrug transporter MDR2 n=1 Tax=Penicillium coprophilum TaxID=36646 RepID=A0A1V6US17_9EURO|nr:hypothetical protein PENCOP_c005G02634 [Penicillium coprophilum]
MGAQAVASTQSEPCDEEASIHISLNDKIRKVDKKEAQPITTSKAFLRVFTYARRWDILALYAGSLAAIGSGVTQPLMFILFGSFVQQFSITAAGDEDGDITNRDDTLNRLCLFVFALFIARFGLASIQKFTFRIIGIRLSVAIRLHYFRHLFDQSIHVLDSLPPGHAAGTITSSSNTLQCGISEKLSSFIECTALIITAFIVALVWNWELSLLIVAGFVVVVLVVGMLFPFTVEGQVRRAKLDSQAATIASESFMGIRIIMAFCAQQQTIEKYDAVVEDAKKEAQKANPITSLQFSLTFFGVFGIIALVFWYGTLMFTKHKLDNVGVITVVLLNLTTIFFSLDRVSSPLQAMVKASIAACEFFSVIDAPVPEKGTIKVPTTEDIVFKKVTFAYPSRPEVKVLDELDLCIEAGKITAIVGPSGSGKSTIVGLIERWYTLTQQHEIHKLEPQNKTQTECDIDHGSRDGDITPCQNLVELHGTITTCGHSLDEIDVKWWRSKIGLVQQEPFLFNDTIYNNVAQGLVGSAWEADLEERKRELVKEACKEAFADEFIDKLPSGYETFIGDGGARLSGGQRQRLAIARSIVKRPDILILDEATSAIDVHSERIIQIALNRISEGRTTIVIAHRLSTIKNADRIVVLRNGKAVESGNHQTLVSQQDGVYAGLVNAQTLCTGSFEDDFSFNKDDISSIPRKGTDAMNEDCGNPPEYEGEAIKKPGGAFGGFIQLFVESNNYWKIMAISIMASVTAGAAQPLHAWMFSRSIDMFKWQHDHPKLMHEVDFMGIMWTVFAASSGIAYFIAFACSGYVASLIRSKYQKEYFRSLIHQRATYFNEDGHSHGTLIARIRDDPHKIENMMGIDLAQAGISTFNIVGNLIMALVYSWKLALVSLAGAGPIGVFSSYIRFRYELQFENLNDKVFAESSQFASEAIGAFRTVTSLTLEDSISDRFETLCQWYVTSAYRKARWVSIILGFSESTNLGCQALIFYYGGRLFIHGEIDTMVFFVCQMAIMNAAEGFGKILTLGPNAAQANIASDRILQARDSSVISLPEKHGFPTQDGGITIEIRDLRLKYPGQKVPVLNGLNMQIEKGQFAALVGASGSGKTSIISLIERFVEPEKGQILFNGTDILDINMYAYRMHLSLVAQEPTLFQGTIQDNILLGMDEASVTNEQLHAACQEASIHDFIISLPEGYGTNIGSRGITLSGGQKQRLAIARALIRNPKVLLLDEATSSLDSESERLVQVSLERAARGRTMIAVAHRLTTIQNADVIFVLGEGGNVLEKGNHIDLLGKRGVYYQMCQNQALDQ